MLTPPQNVSERFSQEFLSRHPKEDLPEWLPSYFNFHFNKSRKGIWRITVSASLINPEPDTRVASPERRPQSIDTEEMVTIAGPHYRSWVLFSVEINEDSLETSVLVDNNPMDINPEALVRLPEPRDGNSEDRQ